MASLLIRNLWGDTDCDSDLNYNHNVIQKGRMCMMGLLQGISNSTMLAWYDEVLQEIGNFLIGEIIGKFLWTLGSIMFVILDLFENVFKSLAGIREGGVTISGDKVEGDLVLYFIESPVVTEIFISMLILSFILLLIFTVFAIVKNQYSEKQEPVSKIIASSCKGLLMYLLVPVATVVCLIVGNVVLQAINEATNTEHSGTSGLLFTAAVYNANKMRDSDLSDAKTALENTWISLPASAWYRIGAEVGVTQGTISELEGPSGRAAMNDIADIIDEEIGNGSFKYSWYNLVGFYDALSVSYITIWVGGAFLIGAIAKIAWGVASRLFKMVIFYAISPIIVATYPIDNGGALGKWRGAMVQQATMAYASVGVINVMYSLVPVINSISFGVDVIATMAARIIIMLMAFNSAKDLISAVSGWFGLGDAYATGESAKGQVKSSISNATKKMTSAAKTTAGTFAGIKGGMQGAEKLGKNKFMGAMHGAWKGSGLAEKTGLDPSKWAKEAKEGVKAGESYYQDLYTNYGEHKKENEAKFKAANAIESQSKGVEAKLNNLEEQFKADTANLSVDSDEYKAIKKRYEDNVKRIKSEAGFVKPLFEARETSLNAMKQDLEERTSNFSAVSSYYKNLEADDDIRAKFNAMLARNHALKDSAGNDRKLTDDEWENVKAGNLDFISHFTGKKEAEKMYSAYAGDMAQIDRSLKEFKQEIKDLYESGADGENYLKSVFGDSFAGDLSTVGDVKSAIEAEQNSINEARKEFKTASDALINDMANKYDDRSRLSDKELEKIGKGLKD